VIPDLVFVYGTLKRGCGNHHTIQRACGEFAGQAVTVDRLPLVVDGLPYLLDRVGQGHRVHGELYRVPDADGWRLLDRLEGHPRFYRRRVIACEVNGGDQVDAWTYFLQGDLGRFAHLTPLREYSRNLEFA
jgi:gamma-glutamylaminecyclotransferase